MHSIHVSGPKMNFSAAHFVQGADDCENLHGHNYSIEVIIEGPLNDHGMVMDFRDLKSHARRICGQLDHRVLLPGESKTINVNEVGESIEVFVKHKRYVFPVEDCVVLPFHATTAELLAEYISSQLSVPVGCKLRVCVSESEGSLGCYETQR